MRGGKGNLVAVCSYLMPGYREKELKLLKSTQWLHSRHQAQVAERKILDRKLFLVEKKKSPLQWSVIGAGCPKRL